MKLGHPLHPLDAARVKAGKLKITRITNLKTGRPTTVLDPVTRTRLQIRQYSDFMKSIEERASMNGWLSEDKVLSSLWGEIQSGETVLSRGQKSLHKESIVRHVDGVQVHVIYQLPCGTWLQLVEQDVKYIDEDDIRERPYAYVSGKSVLGEQSHTTASREVFEETGLSFNPRNFKTQGLRIVKRNSPMYQGLMSIYYFRVFTLEIKEPRHYNPEGYTSDHGKVRSNFRWEPMSQIRAWTDQRLITKVKDELISDW
jgi:ADP-ribose pyrophosphatase YjhB (NUDIX family)